MSFHVFFDFSSGLAGSLTAPKGTLKAIIDHVKWVESELGYETEQYKDNPKHWKSTTPKKGVKDDHFHEVAEEHNNYVRYLYKNFSEWSKNPPIDGETITPEDAKKFWHGLQIIHVPLERWTAEYYKNRMNAIYEAMRGRECEGMTFDAKKPLSIEQANAVIHLFDQYLDAHDIRLEVPKGYDSLYCSDDYAWCEKCGAIHWDDVEYEIRSCRKKGGCKLKESYPEYEEE